MSLLDWNSIENSRHGIAVSIKVPSENFPLRWSSFGRSPLEGTIPCLEFTIEIQSNNLMYNPNKEIRNREFPIKIGKLSVKYYTFEELQR